MSSEKHIRFDLLDGLRGLAAIAVMVYHFTQHNGLHWLGGAWVAVDLFFILSGFVIAHSYGAKLLSGMSFRQFLLVRLIRLGPLYFLGLSIGIFAAMLSMRAGEFGEISSTQLGTAAALGAMWLPYPNNLAWQFGNERIGGPIFPLNDPAWSLFFEAFVNATFFFYVWRFRRLSSVSLVCIAGAIFLACTVLFHQSNPGWGSNNFIFGFPRVVTEFFLGALIYQINFHYKPARPGLTLAIGLLVGALVILGKGAIVNSVTFIPLIVALTAGLRIERDSWKIVCKLLGNISYPLYIVHFPMYRLIWQVEYFRMLTPVAQTIVVSTTCLVLALILSAIDERLRKILSARTANLFLQSDSIQSGGT